jgi:hypothetical protein
MSSSISELIQSHLSAEQSSDVSENKNSREIFKSKSLEPDTFSSYEDAVKAIPNQIKSLIEFSSGGNTSTGVHSFVSSANSDSDNYVLWLLNYGIIYKVEVLIGYDSSSSKPIWKLMNKQIFDSLTSENVLCRLKLYKDKLLKTDEAEDYEPSIYYECFLLKNSSVFTAQKATETNVGELDLSEVIPAVRQAHLEIAKIAARRKV